MKNQSKIAFNHVRAHARFHKSGQVEKSTLANLAHVAWVNGANNPVAMAIAARNIWP